MKFLTELKNSLLETFSSMGASLGETIPKIIIFLVILLLGRVIAKIIMKILHKTFKKIGFDEMIKKVNMDVMLNKVKPGLSASLILAKLAYWLIMLVFITAAANYIGLTFVTAAIAGFFAYMPTLIAALLVLIIGLYIADLAKNVVYTACNSIGISGAKAIASIVYYLLAIMIVITSLR